MTSVNQKEYLKKYLKIGKSHGTKKKRKKTENTLGKRLKIIDDDISLSEEIKEDLAGANEDAPQIVSIIDERPVSLMDNLWKPITEADTVVEAPIAKNSDYSPKRRKICDSEDQSPGRRKTSQADHVSKRRSSSEDQSPRRQRNGDQSPKRRKIAEADHSPIRRRDIVTKDQSPERKRGYDPRDMSPKGRKDEDYSHRKHSQKEKSRMSAADDICIVCSSSCPSKKSYVPVFNEEGTLGSNQRIASLVSKLLKREIIRNPEHHPVICKKCFKLINELEELQNRVAEIKSEILESNNTDDDTSDKEEQESSFVDEPKSKITLSKKLLLMPPSEEEIIRLSPVKSSRDDIEFKFIAVHGDMLVREVDENESKDPEETIEMQEFSGDDAGEILDDGAVDHSSDSDYSPPPKLASTNSGNTLSVAEKSMGVNAATISRKKKTTTPEEDAEQQRKQRELEAKYSRWGKGLKQVEDRDVKIAEQLHEMSKPLARYADDEDLERYQKEQLLEGDPMLMYMRKKRKKQAVEAGVPDKPVYMGDFMPNRYGIRPGFRWDGVDRSNGYEQKLFQAKNSEKASLEEALMWNTEDM